MIRLASALGIAAVLGTGAVPLRQSSVSDATSVRAQVLSVASFGAKGDGETDDTAAIQAGVDALRPGDTLYFPNGTYRIRTDKGILLKDDIKLDLANATLTGPNVRGARCRLLWIEGARNITITGGTLVGSRVGAPEWAIGLLASDADDLVIDGLTARDFFFDGILLTGNRGCRRVQVRRVLAENNRRTGLAIVSANDVTVENSTFRGSNGQSPESGANCEPSAGDSVRNVRFVRSTFSGNAGVGLYIHRALGVEVSNATVESCRMEENRQGIVMSGVQNGTITGCRVARHRAVAASGIALGENTRAVLVSGNEVEDNFRGITAAGATNVTIRGNTVVGMGPPYEASRANDADGITCRGLRSLLADACVITDNSIRNCVGSGILTQLVSRVQVLNNGIQETGRRGIHALSTTNSEIRDNGVLSSSLEAPDRYAPIELANSSNDNIVANNVFIFRGAILKQSSVTIGPGCRGNEQFGNVALPWPRVVPRVRGD